MLISKLSGNMGAKGLGMSIMKNMASALVDGSFMEVSGISVDIKTEDIVEGGENRFTYRLPQSTQFAPLVLKRGLVVGLSELDRWCGSTIQSGFSDIETKLVNINLLGLNRNMTGTFDVLMSWVFFNAYPTKYEVSHFNAGNNEVAVETLQLSYTRYEKIPGLAMMNTMDPLSGSGGIT